MAFRAPLRRVSPSKCVLWLVAWSEEKYVAPSYQSVPIFFPSLSWCLTALQSESQSSSIRQDTWTRTKANITCLLIQLPLGTTRSPEPMPTPSSESLNQNTITILSWVPKSTYLRIYEYNFKAPSSISSFEIFSQIIVVHWKSTIYRQIVYTCHIFLFKSSKYWFILLVCLMIIQHYFFMQTFIQTQSQSPTNFFHYMLHQYHFKNTSTSIALRIYNSFCPNSWVGSSWELAEAHIFISNYIALFLL